jgi:hypothetical protein
VNQLTHTGHCLCYPILRLISELSYFRLRPNESGMQKKPKERRDRSADDKKLRPILSFWINGRSTMKTDLLRRAAIRAAARTSLPLDGLAKLDHPGDPCQLKLLRAVWLTSRFAHAGRGDRKKSSPPHPFV